MKVVVNQGEEDIERRSGPQEDIKGVVRDLLAFEEGPLGGYVVIAIEKCLHRGKGQRRGR